MTDIIPLCEDDFFYSLVSYTGIPIHIWAEIFRWKHRFEIQPIMKELTWYIKKDRTKAINGHWLGIHKEFIGGVSHTFHYGYIGHKQHTKILGDNPDTWLIQQRKGGNTFESRNVNVIQNKSTGIEFLNVSRFHHVFDHGSKENLRQHIIENLGLKAPKSWSIPKLTLQCLKV